MEDAALMFGIFVLGAAIGALMAHAWTSESHPMDIHSGPDDVERRSRRFQQ